MDPDLERPRARPGWLTTFGIIAVVLGSFGIVGGIQMLSQSRASPADVERQFMRSYERMPLMKGQPKELKDGVKLAVPGFIAVEHRWKKQRVALAVANMLLSAMLLIGALQGLRLLPSGRWLWLNASLALIPVELVAATVTILMARDQAEVFVAAMVKAADVPQAAGELAVVRKLWVGVAVTIGGLKALTLVGYYVATLVMLTKERVRALFVAPPARDPAE
ncbi:MAG TPA: hypothetical protein VGQ83_23220 [Polyangia bacterium]|jgi:hypothetical protein